MVTRYLSVIFALILSACAAPGSQPPAESRGPAPVADPAAPEATSASAGLLASAHSASSSGDYERAEALLQRAQRIDSRNGEVYLALARYYRERGKTGAAKGAAERGLLYCRDSECPALKSELRRLER